MQPVIRFSGLHKAYRRHRVLEGIDLDISPGEFFGLVGVNGAGKTTMIKCLLDFCAVDAGSIEIMGRPHVEAAAREQLAFLPERFVPPYYLTGRDFLVFISRMHRCAFDGAKVEALCEAMDLEHDVLVKPVREYSKGMAQKLGLAACMLIDRQVLVLDEPMSGLDPRARTLFKRHLLSLREQGQTVFFSTHLLPDVEELCDRMAILHNGRLLFTGSPQDCCQAWDAFTLEQAFLNCIEHNGLHDSDTRPGQRRSL